MTILKAEFNVHDPKLKESLHTELISKISYDHPRLTGLINPKTKAFLLEGHHDSLGHLNSSNSELT